MGTKVDPVEILSLCLPTLDGSFTLGLVFIDCVKLLYYNSFFLPQDEDDLVEGEVLEDVVEEEEEVELLDANSEFHTSR